jgi:transcription antitermination factor NusA-like protein
MSELGNEKIDIIEWDSHIDKFVSNSLNPAQVNSVTVSDAGAVVVVPDDQLSLAIGKDGQNVRLAVKLTGVDIEIKSNETMSKVTSDGVDADGGEKTDDSVSATTVKKLLKAGVTVDEAKGMLVEDLEGLAGIGKVTAVKIFNELNEKEEDGGEEKRDFCTERW